MANDLVAQLGAKLDNFQRDMNQAGDIADSAVGRIESSFANLNPNLGGFATGLATAFTGVVAGAIGLLAYLKNINGELADIAKNAEFVGVSVEKFQELTFAATQRGVSSEQTVIDLRKVASLLADARDNENSLTKVLDANNVKYRDRNGEVVKLNDFLKIAATTINRFDSFPEKVKAAEMLGLSEQWVTALRNGGKEFQKIAESADEAGVIIDRSTIAKAEAFDIAWKKSTALLGSQFKSIAGDIAGVLDDLIDKAGQFITSFNESRGVTAGSGQSKFNRYADFLRDIFIPQVKEATTFNERFNAAFEGGKVPLPGQRPAGADRADPNRFKLPSRAGEETDSFERETERIQRHIAATNADSIAVLQNNSVQAQLRVEFQLLNAIRKDEGEVTEEQIARYTQLRASMSAESALREAGIKLTDEHAEAFKRLSVSLGIATTHLNKSQETLRQINSASSQLGSALSTAFADAVVEGKNLNEVMTSLLKTLEKAAINSVFASIFNPTAAGGTSLFASLFKGVIPGFASGTTSAPGGWSWVGEHGRELVNLPRGAQVIPEAFASRSGGTQVLNTFMVAGDVSQDTVDRLTTAVVSAHRKIDSQTRIINSTQRLQATGVG